MMLYLASKMGITGFWWKGMTDLQFMLMTHNMRNLTTNYLKLKKL